MILRSRARICVEESGAKVEVGAKGRVGATSEFGCCNKFERFFLRKKMQETIRTNVIMGTRFC